MASSENMPEASAVMSVVPSSMALDECLGVFDNQPKTKPFGSPSGGFTPALDQQMPPDMMSAMYTPHAEGLAPITPGVGNLATERELNELCDFFVPSIAMTQMAGTVIDIPTDGMTITQPRSRHRVLSDKGKQLLSELDYFHGIGAMELEDAVMPDKAPPVSRPRVLSDKGRDLLMSGFDDDAFLSIETARMSMNSGVKTELSPFLNEKDDIPSFLQPSEMSKQPLIMWESNSTAHVKRNRSASANNGLLVPAKQLTRKNSEEKLGQDKSVRKVAKHWSEQEDDRLLQAVQKYGSKNWRKIADFVKTRTAEQSAQRWRKALCPEMKHVVKGKWFPHEDETLRELVAKYGIKGQWKLISRALGGTRSTKQCRERWHHHLDPALKVGNWTEAEDRILLKRHTEVGNSWAQIASALHGRTNDRVKRRFFHLQRKKKRNERAKKSQKNKGKS